MAHQPYDSICAVSIHGPEISDEGTGSGILINSRKGLVLTHGTLLQPLLAEDSNILRQLHATGFVKGENVEQISRADVIFPMNLLVLSDSQKNLKTKLSPSMLNSNLHINSSHFEKFSASVKCIFKCYSLQNIIHKLLSRDSWKFVDSISEDSKKHLNQNEQSLYYLLPCFVVLKLKNWTPVETCLSIKDAADVFQGDMVDICATPFGALNPEIFLNSHSRGIVSNLAGDRNVLILTDARGIPGSEGGALFCCYQKQRYLTGMIVASLCWRNNEWIGLTMAASITEILDSLRGQYNKSSDLITLTNWQPYYGASTDKSRLSCMINRVPLIAVGNTWGSGIILDPHQGLVLTCSHVVKGSEFEKVRLYLSPSQKTEVADIVYKSPLSSNFDLALLSVATDHSDDKRSKKAIQDVPDILEGDPVFVVGHAMFGQKYKMLPSVTMGVVSKIIMADRVPVMIQTTCAVHAGASGGGVFGVKHGQLIGLTVCNAKDTASGACYPHVNMCVPMATIAPVINEYIKTGDPDILRGLVVGNKVVNRFWSMTQEESSVALSSKL